MDEEQREAAMIHFRCMLRNAKNTVNREANKKRFKFNLSISLPNMPSLPMAGKLVRSASAPGKFVTAEYTMNGGQLVATKAC